MRAKVEALALSQSHEIEKEFIEQERKLEAKRAKEAAKQGEWRGTSGDAIAPIDPLCVPNRPNASEKSCEGVRQTLHWKRRWMLSRGACVASSAWFSATVSPPLLCT